MLATAVDETGKTGADDRCNVCLGEFSAADRAWRLPSCPEASHWFHRECITQSLTVSQRCPCCFFVYGTLTGTMPAGHMRVSLLASKLPGFGQSSGTFQIEYSFASGTQGPEHPRPGASYSGQSFVVQRTRALTLLDAPVQALAAWLSCPTTPKAAKCSASSSW